ncbi:amidohydrolase family protein [Nocardia amikacinitolerans]|uniref:amidohydrolase family protein n=1 Tax=Nocardia amikacinitolerans TaxID=756689 RepID=UPI0020A4A18C|nr:amidohydrolase family protein [Nocardia amikacinitolerans]MCP2292072.1 putative metal-dependent hydrolase, TIM-barrel fold [Nocardia amikacinitolerans]
MSSDRIDVHQHLIPPVYREALRARGIDAAGGRELPEWTPEAALRLMSSAGIGSAILSVSTPGTAFLTDPSEAAELARAVNDYAAKLSTDHPDRFGFFATVPMPDVAAAAAEARRALDDLRADGCVLLGNSRGTYLGDEGQDDLFRVLDDRSAVVLVHPADLPADPAPGVPPFATDFLLDTTRAAYLLVRNGIRRRYPNIRFILGHAGGFVPYAAHRMSLSIFDQTGASPVDVLDDFAGFYFDTALSASASALPSLLAFAEPGHVLYGSDWPFAPEPAVHYFNAGLAEYPHLDETARRGIERTNAAALFPRFGGATPSPEAPLLARARRGLRQRVFRTIARAASKR